MKTLVLSTLISFGAAVHAADFTYNPEFKAMRKFASVKKQGKADAQFEKCKGQAQKFAKAAFGEMFAAQKRSVVSTTWLVGGHPNKKGNEDDAEGDLNRYAMEVAVKSSTFRSKGENDMFDYSAFVMMDKKCEMVDTAKFIDTHSPEWETFDMANM